MQRKLVAYVEGLSRWTGGGTAYNGRDAVPDEVLRPCPRSCGDLRL